MRSSARHTRHPSRRPRLGRRGTVSAVAALAAGLIVAGVMAPPAASAGGRPDGVQRGLDALVGPTGPVGAPGALASVEDRHGHTRTYTAGVGDIATGAKVPRDGRVRVGSNTKAFTAVVVLQLVGEGKIRLDEPIETYLPGVVHGDGIDGNVITVRHLLQQTSGLPNYTEYNLQLRYYEPRELVDIALQHPADFAPGESWKYSNTNYVLAGMLVEKVTKHPIARELDQRIIKRLGLHDTYFPAPHDSSIRGPHPRGYDRESPGAPLTDITEMDPSWAWSAGQMVSTDSDLNRFYGRLLKGDLLKPAQLAEMRGDTRPAEKTFGPGARYGLGLVSKPLSCAGGGSELYWGHGGSFPGYETRGGATDTGRAANVAVTVQLGDEAARQRVDDIVTTALCRS
ncbi:serine hydrolase domain-containing protein [Embleya sp. MST-111070]|uniref:serine hydrolase domain-containing protein n=1 Tax=Embleya sp. MST-111070 TaxID=3398231 RepID=UPI003F740100